MPNWCYNYLTIHNVKEFKEKCLNDKNEFRFDNIIRQPEHITLYNNMGADRIPKHLRDNMNAVKEMLREEQVPNEIFIDGVVDYHYTQSWFEEQEEKTGVRRDSWYDWNCDHWGTKWDACGLQAYDSDWLDKMIADEDYLDVDFETAWSPPIPVLEKLAEMGIEFDWHCVEEGNDYAMEGYTTVENKFVYQDVDPSEYDDDEDEEE